MRILFAFFATISALGFGAMSARDRAPDPLPPAQQLNQHALWDAIFEGCTAEGSGNEYLCACAGTYLIDKCMRRPRDEAQVSACLQAQPNIEEATGRCLAYGNLRNGGGVPAPRAFNPPLAPPEAARTTRLNRWVGSYRGCMAQATPEERRRAPSMSYTCACVATFIVNACAPSDATSNDQVLGCIEGIGAPQLEGLSRACDAYGSLRPR